jgi:hypothetical protein
VPERALARKDPIPCLGDRVEVTRTGVSLRGTVQYAEPGVREPQPHRPALVVLLLAQRQRRDELLHSQGFAFTICLSPSTWEAIQRVRVKA